MLREIVLSSTYRRSARRTPAARIDPDNLLLARGPRFRLPAETIRDNALTIAGLLDTTMGGPPVYPPQPAGLWRQTGRNEPKYVVATGPDRFRRGIYVVWRRAAPYPSFVTFDGPDRAACHPRRSITNTPLQALTLMNDRAYVEMALAFARRILTERPDAGDAQRIDFAFRTALARAPNASERQHLLEVVGRERLRLARDPAAVAELLENAAALPAGPNVDATEHATWFFVATILLNLDETITRT